MRVFLDASVLIWAVERPDSNSARIVGLALSGKVNAVVDEVVLSEVARFFRAQRGRSFAWLYSQQVRRVATVLTEADCVNQLEALKGRLKPSDRLHLAAARAAGARVFIALDADFSEFPEYLTPQQAAKRLGLRVSPTDW